MKLGQIIESEKALSELIKEKMPMKVSIDLKLFILAIQDDLKAFYEARDAKIREYGEQDDNGNYTIKDKEKIDLFTKEIYEVLEREIDVNIPSISSDDIPNATISTEDLLKLNWLIK